MITINNLSVSFSGVELFDNVSFVVSDKDKIGLVGKNGAGKSTIMKIIAKKEPLQKGTIIIPKYQSIGYLPQEMIPLQTMTVIEQALTAFSEVQLLEKEIKELEREIENNTNYESVEYQQLLTQHYDCLEKSRLIDAQNAQAQTEKILLGLGFTRNDFDRKVTEFSSGWQMRIELAKILLKRPNTLLLDEPTNHLDIESIRWLESFLINYFGAVILVSHDRTFLDNITKRTIEITAGKIYDYKAGYSQYVEILEQRRQRQQATLTNQQRQIAQIEKFVERFRYKSSKAKQVQSKIKLIEKMSLETIDEVDTSMIHFKFPPPPHSGKVVLRIKSLSKSYGEKEVLKNIDLTISKGDKIAFVGKNGEGKTTLSKIIVGQLTDYSGEFELGHNVVIGYFAQNQAALLDGEKTVFETIDDIAKGEARNRIRSILGSFLFDENDIEKKVKVLSGGEKTRLALAKLILAPINLLVLDEPTNHLDMPSKDILKNALIHYEGTLVLVSHDRDFLCGLTTTLYEFKNKTIKEFKGDVFDYLSFKQIEDLKELELSSNRKEEKLQKTESQNKIDYNQAKEEERKKRKQEKEVERIEKEIEKIENEIKNLDEILSNEESFNNIENISIFFEEYENKKEELKNLMQKWEESIL
ncbi:MAG: ATP-binding cassette domain-containing protein [Bacteroidales bacterium]|jgi:ATP-binding cassette subfamily F protein 3|nr:ATP-binding cassette domain-containing protein [Bacteroidales bacterium]